MTEIPGPRPPMDHDIPSREQCWDEFWAVMADAIAEAKLRQAREESALELG